MNNAMKSLIVRVRQDKKLLIIMLSGVIGMILILLSGVTGQKKEAEVFPEEQARTVEESIKKELEALIRTVDGAGKVKVMVTLDSLNERIVAVNTQTQTGTDSCAYSEEFVIIENSGDSDGLTLRIITPVIRGVGITCEGAGSSVIKQEITKLVSAALGIPANRIWVTKMQE